MTGPALLALALVLDAAMGEPRWLWGRLPHPAVLMGRAVGALDRALNRGASRKAKGAATVTALVAGAATIGWFLSLAGPVADILVAAILLAQRSLADHVGAVAGALRTSLPEGRRAVARIVSRDTADMTEAQVARSAIESAAENLSDGVVAPAFWFLLGGLPGLIVYKVINTADSMIGYRTPRHADFGWAAARLDDLLNLIPARLTALLIAAATGGLGAWRAIASDAARHLSPNAGWPEAAMARALGIALAGPRSYGGQMRELAWVNGAGHREIGANEVERAVWLLWRVWAVCLAVTLAVALVLALPLSG